MKYHTAKTFRVKDAELTAAAKLAYGGAIFLTPESERKIDKRLGFSERKPVIHFPVDVDDVDDVDDQETMKGPSRRALAALETELRIEAEMEAAAEMKNINAA